MNINNAYYDVINDCYWKDCTNKKYEVSNTGLIRHKKFKRILKPIKRRHTKYKYYDMIVNLDKKATSIAREVAKAFIDNPENKPEIDHIDTNTENNNVDNLRWVTHAENMKNPNTVYNQRQTINKYYPVKCNETGQIFNNVNELIIFLHNNVSDAYCRYMFDKHMKGTLHTFGGYTFTSLKINSDENK